MKVLRTEKCKIENYSQVVDRIDELSISVCKLWNVARYKCEREWRKTGKIPSESKLKSKLKEHRRYRELHSQTAQNVIEELWNAFKSWFEKRKNDSKARPPGYRRKNGRYPKASVTFKKSAICHDKKNKRLKLSNGRENSSLLVEYKSRPEVDLDRIQVVRLAWNGDRWQIHITHRKEIEPQSPGAQVCAIDLGVNNFATIVYDDGTSELYPENKLKEDEYYFLKKIAKCNKSNSNKARRLHKKRGRRREHFLHALSKEIMGRCEEKKVGRIIVGNLKSIRENETKNNNNYNLKLGQWPYEKFVQLLTYKAEKTGIEVVKMDESHTSQKCPRCGVIDRKNRVERGLYKCSNCGFTIHADVNGALNLLQKVTALSGSNGSVAEPVVNLFAVRSGISPSGCEEGKFHQAEQLQTLNSQPHTP
ncbi:hypothetical protein AKJ48_01285 [candidate division MSBL1 archaeon SCGC-AAA261O19]|uniref:Transposase n=3 Tax=candidate division MSBL1 TaxID=215777 RepID=A0A133V220_9EURY|nr:hypothetical protein AKJ42_00465 [candidate division MSBL1 archaeon SCGC-AAA261C02]KXB04826.1 hypothetical protein AKJ48_01285 [candidate division MSBL1 archaeon SCGC-AAA261O19]KXB09328.1 hypothetical protein AKJ46_00560 [candidate division MSBL1 archaeon SCGC-AAA833K04]